MENAAAVLPLYLKGIAVSPPQWGSPRCKFRLQTGKTCTQGRASPFWWGVWFFRLRRKNHTPHSKGEREGTWFPHTPAGDPR